MPSLSSQQAQFCLQDSWWHVKLWSYMYSKNQSSTTFCTVKLTTVKCKTIALSGYIIRPSIVTHFHTTQRIKMKCIIMVTKIPKVSYIENVDLQGIKLVCNIGMDSTFPWNWYEVRVTFYCKFQVGCPQNATPKHDPTNRTQKTR